MANPIDPCEFVRVLRPALAAGDAAALADAVLTRWRVRDVCPLLRHPETDVRRVAAVALGLVGDRSVEECLVRALRDRDEQVNQMAEHGLWSIWMRSGSPESTKPFQEGMALLAVEDYKLAIERFENASQIDPSFAEAYNQCAIAHFFVGEWKQSIDHCCKTASLVPAHFGAISGMGHCYAQLGQLPLALRCYKRSLQINPRMTAIAAAAQKMEQTMRDPGESGVFEVRSIV